MKKATYLPRFDSINVALSLLRFIIPIIVHDGLSVRLRIACSKQCGAISMTTAFSGICFNASWKRTGLTKLLTWYSADESESRSVAHFFSSTELLIQRFERGRSSLNIYRNRNPNNMISVVNNENSNNNCINYLLLWLCECCHSMSC